MPRPAIQDEFTKLTLSKQRKWQLRQRKKSRCIICGRKTRHQFCKKHLKANSEAHKRSRKVS